MPFLSFEFGIFLGVALLVFHLSPPRWRPNVLLGFSYLFYLTWSAWHTVLLGAVTAAVYWAGRRMGTLKGKRGGFAWLILTVAALLVLLFAFKAGWWLQKEFASAGNRMSVAALVIAPLGLSYYVFKMLGYLLDVYWESIPPEPSFVAVALYGAFFPQIVSGPIQRAGDFFEQMSRVRHPEADEFAAGLKRILFGLFKKIVVADQLGVMVGNVFAHPWEYSRIELMAGAYGFAIQLYMDFSGITDLAIGIGMLFGMKGPENFNRPFWAANMQQFWRRWHMSLTTWLTDYLFTPLWMSLRGLGKLGLCLAIMINMVAIGLWHGLGWTFLVFGALNGVFMIVSALTLKKRDRFFEGRPGWAAVRLAVGRVATFHLVAFTEIFFRSPTLGAAVVYLKGLGRAAGGIPAARLDPRLLGTSWRTLAVCAAGYLAAEAVTWAGQQVEWRDWYAARPMALRRGMEIGLATMALLMFHGAVTFIYARF